jgi:hypothetical protein
MAFAVSPVEIGQAKAVEIVPKKAKGRDRSSMGW